jgi:hypothetical protein
VSSFNKKTNVVGTLPEFVDACVTIERCYMNKAALLITWPVTLDGVLGPAWGKVNQYEFHIDNPSYVNTKLPLIPGNPYVVTSSTIKNKRNKGIKATCNFGPYTVIGQYHRTSEGGIWLGSNRTKGGAVATKQWHTFVGHFGVKVGCNNMTIPVHLDFYPTLQVCIRKAIPKVLPVVP